MKLIIDLKQSKTLIRVLNLSDLKVLIYLIDRFGQSGFVLNSSLRLWLVNELSLSRQTITIALERLLQFELLIDSNDIININPNLIEIC